MSDQIPIVRYPAIPVEGAENDWSDPIPVYRPTLRASNAQAGAHWLRVLSILIVGLGYAAWLVFG